MFFSCNPLSKQCFSWQLVILSHYSYCTWLDFLFKGQTISSPLERAPSRAPGIMSAISSPGSDDVALWAAIVAHHYVLILKMLKMK